MRKKSLVNIEFIPAIHGFEGSVLPLNGGEPEAGNRFDRAVRALIVNWQSLLKKGAASR